MTPADANVIREQCAVIAENKLDGSHEGNLRAELIAEDIRASKQPEWTIDPTTWGDLVAEKMRRWYEANRETWWDRHSRNADRRGAHADEFILRLIQAVHHAEQEVQQ